jgi:hypothetical protein
MKSICSPPTAFCLLPTDTVGGMSQVVGGGRTGVRMKSVYSSPTAFCIRGEFELAGLLACTAVCDKTSPSTAKEETSNFQK